MLDMLSFPGENQRAPLCMIEHAHVGVPLHVNIPDLQAMALESTLVYSTYCKSKCLLESLHACPDPVKQWFHKATLW